MKQAMAVGREALSNALEHREDFMSESFMSTFAAVGALLLELRAGDAAPPDAVAPDAARLAPPIALAGGDAPASPVSSEAAYLAAFGALVPAPAQSDPTLSAAAAPPDDNQLAPEETVDSVATLSAPTPVLSSAPVAAAARVANPDVTLTTAPGLAQGADLFGALQPSTPAAAVALAGLADQPAAGFEVAPLAAATAEAGASAAHRVEAASGDGLAVANPASALVNEIAALVELATQVAFVPEALQVGASDAFASFSITPGFATLETPVLEFVGDAASFRSPAGVFGLAQPRTV